MKNISIFKAKFLFSGLVSVLLFFNGCGEDKNEVQKLSPEVSYCNSRNGVVVKDINNEDICKYIETYDYDEGEQNYTISCNLENFYNNQGCEDSEDEEFQDSQNNNGGLLLLGAKPNNSIGEVFHQSVKNILNNLDNTGYTHRNHGPFILHPNYTKLLITDENGKKELNSTIKSYNLFLDCSGFVGYYVLQGISPKLYNDIGKCYTRSRSLAADFADTFENAKYTTTDANVTDASFSDLNNSSLQWGRVNKIEDAKAGDILVYKHKKNIIHNGECNNTIKKHKNTGHVMFIMSEPVNSTKYKASMLVKIADSTTAPHSHDSRKIKSIKYDFFNNKYIYTIDNISTYNENTYTAWSKRNKKDYLELCYDENNDTFYRRCEDHGLEKQLQILPQTTKINSPTGIGAGSIYIYKDMMHYRVKKYADKEEATILIGRPIIVKK